MKQRSLAETGFERRSKLTKRQRFLNEMDAVMPWAQLVSLASKAQPKPGPRGGRVPFPAETMLRIHFMQQWFALSDPAMEEALHDIPAMRAFAKLDAGEDALPDESSILRFRHRLEKHELALPLLATVNAVLQEKGLLLRQGTIVDATLIAAPADYKGAGSYARIKAGKTGAVRLRTQDLCGTKEPEGDLLKSSPWMIFESAPCRLT